MTICIAPGCEWICCGGDRGHVQPLLCKSKQLNEGAEIQTQKVGTQERVRAGAQVGGVGASWQPKHQVPLSAALPTPQGKGCLGGSLRSGAAPGVLLRASLPLKHGFMRWWVM